ncbi:hypothetical protein E2C01_029047 [Portunus trituberculatus]|uniref:Uncharacterized protein n=1 Tax=Portunus trituberculatus TaxID=210409 RepID=A0A5B7EMC6_PORTR|nr:hypothetical protein [Portunus trituberculatus]
MLVSTPPRWFLRRPDGALTLTVAHLACSPAPCLSKPLPSPTSVLPSPSPLSSLPRAVSISFHHSSQHIKHHLHCANFGPVIDQLQLLLHVATICTGFSYGRGEHLEPSAKSLAHETRRGWRRRSETAKEGRCRADRDGTGCGYG